MSQQSRWKRLGVKTKALFGELRKVTYPSAKQVLKQTSIVLAVVIFFLIVLMAQDQLLLLAYRYLVGADRPQISAVSPLTEIGNLFSYGFNSIRSLF
ncbi:MAG: preprotein translocase subunit SecE [Firmicutes bacterium]|nr:preprotein translocase subunit SecE [Bacillota bacterium]